jgi:hypothetical protein
MYEQKLESELKGKSKMAAKRDSNDQVVTVCVTIQLMVLYIISRHNTIGRDG